MASAVHSRLIQRIDALPRFAALTAIAVGMIVLVGWILDIELLKGLHPSLVPMKANAALAFVLTGTSLLLMHSSEKNKQRKSVARFLAVFVIVIGSLTSIEYVSGWDIGIDQLLFKDVQEASAPLQKGRMPFTAAISFIFLGTSMLVLGLKTRNGNMPSQILALSVGFLGMVGVLGYIYDLQAILGFAVYTRMAAHGAVTFIVLSIGMLALKPQEGIMGEITGNSVAGFMIRRLLPAAVGIPVVIGWITAQGEGLGLYGNRFGHVIEAVAYIAIGLVVVWKTGRSLAAIDAERKGVEKELLKSEKHFKELFDDAPVGYHELDHEGRIKRVNQTELQMLGYRAEEMQGHFVWEFLDDQATSRQSVLAKLSGSKAPAKGVERVYRRKDLTTMIFVSEEMLLRDAEGLITGIRTTLQDVTELKQVRHLLRERDEKYGTVLQSLAEGVGIVDSDEHFTYVNRAAETIFGLPAGSLVGHGLREFLDPFEYEKIQEQTGKRQHGETASYEIQFTRPDGVKRDLLVTVSPYVDNHGEFVGSIGVFRDLTDRKREERLTETLHSISQALYSTDSLNGLFEHIHRDLASIMPAANFFIALLSDAGDKLTFPYGSDETETGDWPTIDADDLQSLTVEVLRSKRLLLLNEKDLRERYASGKNKVWGTAPKCWLGVPLIIGEEAIGVMAVQDYKRSDAYSPKDMALFQAAAGQVALAIERKRSEESLKQSVSLLQATLESTADGILVVDNSGKIASYNKEFAEMWSLPEDVIVSRDDNRALNHVLGQLKNPEAFISKVRDLYAHPDESSFDMLEFKDGKLFERYSLPQRVEGKPVGRVWSFRDITARKQVEHEIRLLAHTVSSTKDCVSITDLEDNIIFVNDAFLQTYGYTREELMGQPVSIVRSAQTSREVGRQILTATLAGGWYGEIFNRRKDGSEFPIELWTSMVKDDTGTLVATVGVARDITVRKADEQERESLIDELRTALERVRTLGGLLPICASCKKIRDDKGYWNQLEKYLVDHTEAKLTHGLCPDCAKLYFPEQTAKSSPGGNR